MRELGRMFYKESERLLCVHEHIRANETDRGSQGDLERGQMKRGSGRDCVIMTNSKNSPQLEEDQRRDKKGKL